MQITEEALLRIHEQMITLNGGAPGVRQNERVSVLLALLAQSSTPEADLFEMAALYWVALARGHLFNAANKSTALAAALYLLERNGGTLRSGKDELAQLVALANDAATGARGVDELAAQLRALAI